MRCANIENFEKKNVEKKPVSSFGGLKKGFLSTKPNVKDNDLIYVKANPNIKTDLKINDDIKDSLKGSASVDSKGLNKIRNKSY